MKGTSAIIVKKREAQEIVHYTKGEAEAMSERSTKFCQDLYHKLGLYVDSQRSKGLSDRAIFRKLEAMESCGISCEGWKKRIQHGDTCTHLGVKPHLLSQSETRKLRRLSKRDQTRVKQALKDRLSNNGKDLGPKETRKVFKQALAKVDPVILRKRRVVPQAASAKSSPTGSFMPKSAPVESTVVAGSQGLGEKPSSPLGVRMVKDDLSHLEPVEVNPMFPAEWKQWKPTETNLGLVDPSQFKHSRFPTECLCRFCPKALECISGAKPRKG